MCAAPLAAAAGGCRGLKGRPAPALRSVSGCSPRCQQGLSCRQSVEMRSLQQSLACRRGPLLVGCFMVWPSCQEALDAPRLMCSPPVRPLLLNMDSHLMNRMWPQWNHLSPLRLGADSLWLPSGAFHVLTPREASSTLICPTGRPCGKSRGSLQLTPGEELSPFATDLRAEPCPQPPSNPGQAHRLPSQVCS